MSEYSRTYEIRWSDLDANNHVNACACANTGWKVERVDFNRMYLLNPLRL